MTQLCLSCSERPATSTSGTVALCAQCAALVAETSNSRGVKYTKPDQDAKK